MRIVTALTLILLLFPVGVWGQGQATSGTGHFEGWLSDVRWGADRQTLDVTFGVRRVAATFTVAQNGFGWHLPFISRRETFNAWEDVTAWCWGRDLVSFLTRQHLPRGNGVIYVLEPEDIVTIVDGYFKKYVPELEWSSPSRECTPAGLARLNGRNPADMARIVQLLEAASSQEPSVGRSSGGRRDPAP